MIFVYVYIGIVVFMFLLALYFRIKDGKYIGAKKNSYVEQDINRIRTLQDIEYYRKISGIDRIPYGKPIDKE